MCVCGGGCGAAGILLDTQHVLQYQSLLASPAGWFRGRLELPRSNLLCFLTPVKLHPELCLCTCVCALHAKQNFLPPRRHFPVAQPVAACLPTPTPSLSFTAGVEEGNWEVFWGVVILGVRGEQQNPEGVCCFSSLKWSL